MKNEDCIGIRQLGMLFVLLSILYSSLSAVPVGKFSYCYAPESLNGDTVIVNDMVVGMSEKVRAFPDPMIGADTTSPSLFFIIDNSSSMAMTNGSDPTGNRFTAASAFIDTIMEKYPKAEVGLAVFSRGLYYSTASKPGIFQTVAAPTMGLDDTGAFVPLLMLKGNYGNQTGYEILKEVLAVSNGSLTYPSILPNQQGSNIGCGFDAALQAFSRSSFSRGSQFIIFFYDGETSGELTSPAFPNAMYCPTTFTVFFTSGTELPSAISTYTANCKINNYSASNPNSNAWAYDNTTPDALVTFLMKNVFDYLGRIAIGPLAEPATMTINSQTNTSPWSFGSNFFTFPSLFPLQCSITPFSSILTFTFHDLTVSKDIKFWVKIQKGAELPPTKYEVFTWDRNLIFRDTAGAAISALTESMDEIDLNFTFTRIDTLYTYTNVSIELSYTLTPSDKETIVLIKGPNGFNGRFKRETSDQPTIGNNILETRADHDSIVAVFRNSETPKLPLDTLRIAIPFKNESSIRSLNKMKVRLPARQLVIGSSTFDLERPKEPFTLRINDIKGAVVKKIAFKNPHSSLPSNLLPKKSGLYIITVTTNQKRKSTRVLITR